MNDSQYVSGSLFLSTLLETILSRPVGKAHGFVVDALEQHGIECEIHGASLALGKLVLTSGSDETIDLNWLNRKTATYTIARVGEMMGY